MDDCDITQSKVFKSGIFTSITNINIFVDKNELDVQWDKNYPGWHNGNKVYYKGEWVEIAFDNNNSKRKEYYSINQIIRQPIIRDYKTVSHLYSFIGWDIDGDGNPDSFPATSNVNIEAKAIYSSKLRKYLVTYYGMDQKYKGMESLKRAFGYNGICSDRSDLRDEYYYLDCPKCIFYCCNSHYYCITART